MYGGLLADLDEVILPPNGDRFVSPVHHLYVIRTRFRDELKAWLWQNGVQCGIHYPCPIHLQPVYRRLFGYKEGDFPKSELLSKTALSLPMFPELEKKEIAGVNEKYIRAEVSDTDLTIFIYEDEAGIQGSDVDCRFEAPDYHSNNSLISAFVQKTMELIG